MQEVEFQNEFTQWLDKQQDVLCGDKRGHYWHLLFLCMDCPMSDEVNNAYPT